MNDARLAEQALAGSQKISLSAENSWATAAPLLFPVLRPAGSSGRRLDALATSSSAAGTIDLLIDDGPADLVIAYAITAGGFDVLANGDHLAAWAISPETLREAAYRNLEAWSRTAPWSEETSGDRQILSSDTGDGWDASRILLPSAVAHLESTLRGPGDRVLVGLPARHLLIAAAWKAADPDFAALFADFVLEYAADSDEAIDRRVFELAAGRLAPLERSTTG